MGKKIDSTYNELIGNCRKMLLEYEKTKSILK
jgi:hypothetical protein